MNFETQLKTAKLKVTPQRLAILNEVHKNEHTSIDLIYDKIKAKYPSISLATVYKNISTLCDASILKEVKTPNHKQRYEINCGEHLHVLCQVCGKLEDIKIDVDLFKTYYSNKSGYVLNDVQAVFTGVCPECASKAKLKS